MGFFVKLVTKPRSMKTLRLLTALALVLAATTSNRALACAQRPLPSTPRWVLPNLKKGASLAGDPTSVSVTLNYTGGGGSYPADMMVHIYAPDGSCVVWGG